MGKLKVTIPFPDKSTIGKFIRIASKPQFLWYALGVVAAVMSWVLYDERIKDFYKQNDVCSSATFGASLNALIQPVSYFGLLSVVLVVGLVSVLISKLLHVLNLKYSFAHVYVKLVLFLFLSVGALFLHARCSA